MKHWLIMLLLLPAMLQAESKRIQVYSISQTYYDVKPGDTLGEIAKQIHPGSHRIQHRLMRDIVELNPNAFINNNPDRLKANIRLWLPNHTAAASQRFNREKYLIKEYSWGYTKTPR